MSEEAPPGERPKTTNQGPSGLCTRHALGNAIVNAGDKQSIDFNLNSAIATLVNSTDNPNVDDGAFPTEFDAAKIKKPFVLQDQKTKAWWYVTLGVTKCDKVDDYNIKNEFVLVYTTQSGGRHCVYIAKRKGTKWVCLNSWGKNNEPDPRIDVNKSGNVIYNVVVTLYKDIDLVKKAFGSGQHEAVKDLAETYLNNWKSQKVNIAIIGASGTGKSTLINTLRGLRKKDAGAAKTGVTETTMEPQMYDFPENPNIKIWDIPGMGTKNFPKATYFDKIDGSLGWNVPGLTFDTLDAFIIVAANRFTEFDHDFVNHVNNIKKPLFFVRTKVDEDIRSVALENDELEDDESLQIETLGTIRNDIEENLNNIEINGLFLISGMWAHRNKWEFKDLYNRIVGSLLYLQKEAFLLSVQIFTPEMIQEKVLMLQNRIFWVHSKWWAAAAGAGAAGAATESSVVVSGGAGAGVAGTGLAGAVLVGAAAACGFGAVAGVASAAGAVAAGAATGAVAAGAGAAGGIVAGAAGAGAIVAGAAGAGAGAAAGAAAGAGIVAGADAGAAAAGAIAKVFGFQDDTLSSGPGGMYEGTDKLSHPGLKATLGQIIEREVMFERETLGIDKNNISDLAKKIGKTESDVMELIDVRSYPISSKSWAWANLYEELSSNEKSAMEKMKLLHKYVGK